MNKCSRGVAIMCTCAVASMAGGYPHPFTVTKPAEVSHIKSLIAAGKEPQKSAYARLLSNANSALSMSPTTATTLNIMGGYATNSNLKEMRALLADKNANPTYTLALAYLFSGDEKYARKAITFLDAWTRSDCSFEGADAPLQLGSHFSPMIFAADILWECPLWGASNRAAFEDFWRRRCVRRMSAAFVEHVNNWMDNGLMGYLATGITFGDTALINRAMAVLNTYHQGNWKMTRDAAKGITYLPREVIRNDGVDGITYTAYSLTAMVVDFDMARNLGVDLWSRKTAEGATIQGLIQTFFEWNTGIRSFPWNRSPDKSVDRMNSIEVGNTRCALSSQAKSWLSSHRPVVMRHGELYATLLKGDLANMAVPSLHTGSLRQVRGSVSFRELVAADQRLLFNASGRILEIRKAAMWAPSVAISPAAEGPVAGFIR